MSLKIDENRLKKTATIASVGTAVLLVIVKAVAAFFTGSLSVLSSMTDSLADVFSSLISFIAVHYAAKPLSEEHRYGYGKSESVSALLQAAFIVGSAGFILYDGIYRFIHPQKVNDTAFGIGVMLFCLFCTVLLVLFQRYVINKTKSQAIAADSLHYVVDILSNSSVIFSLFIVKYLHWEWFDIVTAVAISLYLIYNAWQLALDALQEITDKELDAKIKENIIRLMCSVEGVLGCHDLRSRISGSRWFVEIHLEFDGNKTLTETHALTDLAEHKVIEVYPQIQLIVHQDPHGLKEDRIDNFITDESL
ncbi:MAG: cation diffusion facilitator family transporter [Alphaproteobacteria bacterium]|nr:cation diffusion facilitator family transporter [Alphaproteobacteria bacterium]